MCRHACRRPRRYPDAAPERSALRGRHRLPRCWSWRACPRDAGGITDGDSVAALLVALIHLRHRGAASDRAPNANVLMDRAPVEARGVLAERAIAALGCGRRARPAAPARVRRSLLQRRGRQRAAGPSRGRGSSRRRTSSRSALEAGAPGQRRGGAGEPRRQGLDLRDRVLSIALVGAACQGGARHHDLRTGRFGERGRCT